MTAQICDTLVYKNETYGISSEPLESYLKNKELPHKLIAINTACWRGYFASWEIINNRLFLTEWSGNIQGYQQVDMSYLFGDERVVYANWFTGNIYINIGDIVVYHHFGYSSIYEGQLILEFKFGKLIKVTKKWLTQEEIDKLLFEDNELPF